MKLTKVYGFAAVLMFAFAAPAVAQAPQSKKEKEAAYVKVVTPRADKIVATLGITDSSTYKKVRSIMVDQYWSLSEIHDARNEKIKAAKAEGLEKAALEAKIKGYEDEANAKLDKQHKKYLSALKKKLNEDQVTKVKDGMTYGVVPITYRGYVEMLPEMKEEHKQQIMAWLVEAREHAMDAESSDKKHAWFGKYKGKINNMLSAAGYDTKTARAVWEKKLKEREDAARAAKAAH
ncbi:DUF3826 domain-containing protein [Paraflavisolibacter sp. H34]|uniref:DUF3826 domain-containing protein n=1 Tax=Huijunlia imazamoxiresistens TaxID=3127457 RepID=UPI003018E600